MNLTKAQYRAVTHHQGPCMVLAGPGSGKTLTIVKRVEYLISKYHIRPEEILVVTFTRAAAREMKERFCREVRRKDLPVTFGTFHSVFYGILKWAYNMPTDCFLKENEQIVILEEILQERNMDYDYDLLTGLLAEIGKFKSKNIKMEDYEVMTRTWQSSFSEIYHSYEEQKAKRRKIDFDDMLLMCLKLFQNHPDILNKWQGRFGYILVDEFQDINPVQYEVIRLLSDRHKNIFIVGDDDQSIYGFRGSDPRIMKDFEKEHPNILKILLDTNFRSSGAIVESAGRLIFHNEGRFSKNIRGAKDRGAEVLLHESENSVAESLFVVERIKELIDRGTSPQRIAVIFRTRGDVVSMVESLTEFGIPFYIKEHITNLYDHFISQDIISYARIAVGEGRRRDFLRIANRPNRYITRESLDEEEVTFEKLKVFFAEKEWMQEYLEDFEKDVQFLKHTAPYSGIQYIRKKIGYDCYLREYAKKRQIKEETLFEIIFWLEERAKAYRTFAEWFNHIEEYSRFFTEREQQNDNKAEGINLLTMHGAKGLEYETVFVLQTNEGIIPHRKAVFPHEIEEERRLFYVAVTRAERLLYISLVNEKNGKESAPSRFLDELF